MSLGALLREAAEEAGHRQWLTTPRETRTFGQFWEEARTVAAALLDRGVRPGQRVGLFAGNGLEFLLGWFGTVLAGGVAVPVNAGFRAAEARYVLDHAEAVAVFVDASTVEVMREIRDQLPQVHTVVGIRTGEEAGLLSMDDLLRYDPLGVDEVHRPRPDDIASILYTSGTTGHPKGCLLGHEYYRIGANAVADQLQLTDADVMMCVLPLFHMNAQVSSVTTSLTTRARLILEDRFSASRFWSVVRQHSVTEFSYLGVIPAALYKLPPDPADRDNTLRVGFGAGIPADIHAAFEERFGVAMLEVFGMTETGMDLATRLVPDRKVGTRTVGTVVPGKHVRIVDDNGVEVPPGQVGHLQVYGPGLFRGYFKDPEATAQAFDGPWFRTGDLAMRDEDGWYYYVDRQKDIVRRAGENISSVEVEAVLTDHPAVANAAVIGVPDDVVGQEVKALLILQDGYSATPELFEEILQHCAQRLAAFKVPRFLQVLDEFPRTGSQKIQKSELRKRYGTAQASYERTWRPDRREQAAR